MSSTKEESTKLVNFSKYTLKEILLFLKEQNFSQWLECTDKALVT